jgi:cellulose synthase/poly-beta-1,6-N-acetylglucosamine synthase-like glycosyltransferase
MNWNHWIRQIHRWLSIAFTVAVIVTFVALRQEKPPVWVNFLALPPLFLLLFTGLYRSCCRMPPDGAAGHAPTRRTAGRTT